ncbi:MAG TPA: hypothetical protein P5205_06595 [Candidatus Paceibacterota bacterium]|nr:hypothetical protein [Verrucomicrobiota bacterium]HSA10024.1 hypothetical protein [Candidatus Paceibacterota bacterium]
MNWPPTLDIERLAFVKPGWINLVFGAAIPLTASNARLAVTMQPFACRGLG